MTYEEMQNKANLYNEMLKMHTKKPRLIAESERKIVALKQEIKGLESDNAQEVLGKMNPQKFSFLKKQTVDIQELILKKEIEIRKEENNIEVLYEANTIDLIDIDEVVKEINTILAKKEKETEGIAKNVLKARAEYHRLVDEYKDEYEHQRIFENNTRKKVLAMREEAYIPQYARDKTYEGFGEKVNFYFENEDVAKGHRRKPMENATLRDWIR